MTTNTQKTTLTKDLANKKIFVSRQFNAPRANVWEAWTTSKLLDTWWAPKPWKAKTKSMNFTEGGFWLYKMEGPDGNGMWARADYEKIDAKNYFTALDAFCDEAGTINTEFPRMHWKNTFIEKGNTTNVEIEITFKKVEDLHKIIEMGFEEGFKSGLSNLDELLANATPKHA